MSIVRIVVMCNMRTMINYRIQKINSKSIFKNISLEYIFLLQVDKRYHVKSYVSKM